MGSISSGLAKAYTYISEKSYVRLILTALSLASINFSIYIAHFDFNAMSLVDATAVSRHTFRLVILYTVVSYIFHFYFSYAKHQSEIFDKILWPFLALTTIISTLFIHPIFIIFFGNKKIKIRKTFKIVLSKLSRSISDSKLLVPPLVFSFFYIGIINTVYFFASILIMFTFFFLAEPSMHEIREKSDEHEKTSNEIDIGINKMDLTTELREGIEELDRGALHVVGYFIALKSCLNKNRLIKIITEKSWVFLILISILLGFFRADFSEKNIQVKLNEDTVTVYSLFMTTSSGIGLYSLKERQVRFVSWDNVNQVIYVSEKRKSYN